MLMDEAKKNVTLDLKNPPDTVVLDPDMWLLFENEFAAGIESVITVTKTGAQLISQVPVEVFIC